MSAPPALVELTRGPIVEAIHRGDLAVVSADGSRVASVGDPGRKVTYWRSSAKPFQAMPLVYTGAAERFGLDAADLALCSASHQGEPMHTERVLRILERIGCGPDDLRCGAHAPYDGPTADALRQAGDRPSALHNNCSGKHAGMLVLARHLGAPAETYLEPDHPVQRAILANVRLVTGLDEIATSVDGCGVPCFALSVERMALAFARLMTPEALGEPFATAAGAIRDAMRTHPALVGGTGRFDTDLMREANGRLVSKGGASGVLCIGIDDGRGLALKIEDGAVTPGYSRGVACIEALRQLGVLDDATVSLLASHARPQLRNVAGGVVGEARPAFTLTVAS